MSFSRFLTILCAPFLLGTHLTASVPLKLERSSGERPATFTETDGIVEIIGALDLTATPTNTVRQDFNVLEFEYFCVGGVPAFNIFTKPRSKDTAAIPMPPIGHSEGWATYAAPIEKGERKLPAGWKQLRLELPLPADRMIQIRNVNLRRAWPGEFAEKNDTPGASTPEPILTAYLDAKFPGTISEVSIGKDYIRIVGNTGGEEGSFALADVPMDVILDDPASFQSLVEITPSATGAFIVDTPRLRKRDGLDYDRLTSRWHIVSRAEVGFVRKSHSRYGDRVESRSPDLPAAAPKSKKGLGGWHDTELTTELEDLGISAVTKNMSLHGMVSIKPGPGMIPTLWQGRTYYIRKKSLQKFDKAFREAQEKNIMVSVVLLVGNPAKSNDPVVKMISHPDAHREGIFGMPNVTSPEGIGLYGAVLNFAAERWSRPDGKYGRVHHWIMQNEVDAGWVWTNAGVKSDVTYMDLYHRSMRLMDLIARQYDPNSKPFISLTHHWANAGTPRFYGSKRMLELLVKFTNAEGDFPWGLAYHPYPQSLRNPRTWEDDLVTFSFDTEKITPWNIEVLDAYMNQPKMLYQGQVRTVHLSENGFNSPNYSAKSMEDQAAGMALAWKKIQRLSSIQSWQYHNWIDNRHEGGLRIGLRKFPDAEGDPYGKKPIWYLYQASGTPEEEEVFAPYLQTIGINSWDEIIHTGPIK